MLIQCSTSVADAGPTLNQRLVNVSCLCGGSKIGRRQRVGCFWTGLGLDVSLFSPLSNKFSKQINRRSGGHRRAPFLVVVFTPINNQWDSRDSGESRTKKAGFVGVIFRELFGIIGNIAKVLRLYTYAIYQGYVQYVWYRACVTKQPCATGQ